MPYQILVFLHVGSMFLATAFALGPSTMLFLTARSGDRGAIERTFGFATPVFRVGGIAYGLGVLFGVLTAVNGSIDLTTTWLVMSYVLVLLLITTNLFFERWARRVEASVGGDLRGGARPVAAVVHERAAGVSLAAMVVITLAIVFVMVVKPGP